MSPLCIPIVVFAVVVVVIGMAVFTASFGISDEFYKEG